MEIKVCREFFEHWLERCRTWKDFQECLNEILNAGFDLYYRKKGRAYNFRHLEELDKIAFYLESGERITLSIPNAYLYLSVKKGVRI